jgi:hypothetical protein
MAMNPLPPQAYTKETLQKAYTWLLSQSPSIKDMASTQDMLISLYLKAQRNGDASLETPSIQNFKQELKSLAGLMGDLQTPNNGSNQHSPKQATAAPASAAPALGSQSLFQNSESNVRTDSSLMAQLDPTSLQALADVKTTFNLSSEVEALRVLISLGYKQFKKIN